MNVYTRLNVPGVHVRRGFIRRAVPETGLKNTSNEASNITLLPLIGRLKDEHIHLNMVSSEMAFPVELSRGSVTGRVLSLDSLAFRVGKCLLNWGR